MKFRVVLEPSEEGGYTVIVPAHRPIKRSTLSHILKQARLSVSEFNDLL